MYTHEEEENLCVKNKLSTSISIGEPAALRATIPQISLYLYLLRLRHSRFSIQYHTMYIRENSLHGVVRFIAFLCILPYLLYFPFPKHERPSSLTDFFLVNIIVLALLFPSIFRNPSTASDRGRSLITDRHPCPDDGKTLNKSLYNRKRFGGQGNAPWGEAKHTRNDLPLRTRKRVEGRRIAYITHAFAERQQIHSSQDVVASHHIYATASAATILYIGKARSQEVTMPTNPQKALPPVVERPRGRSQQQRSEELANLTCTGDMDKRFDEFISSFFARVRAEIRESRD
ncbi:hypothetical protein KP509_29G010300 [Ceratopteris richardii]|uniref:Uncharacterized protein n=1 Tax=Ceratopteris richardii TaxID=49495 RepID=A0A8T2R5L9_CERRI|nr:hypothetical protein KP509_29G010300 [Ceratopteris richardii]